ncbi:MAG: transketolase [Spirochaetaceae bacterium]|nr:MAG: transketolase [Spirochaetaceae bacterium]
MNSNTKPDPAARIQRLREIAQQVRFHVVDMVHHVQSGHIGGSLSAAEILTALYFDILNIDPDNPRWPDRDRMMMSKGHACPVLYASLALRGFFPLDELHTLRQFETRLQGHPVIKTPGVDMTTGSLGIGFSISVGMAMEAKLSGASYNVYAVLGDGELNEGVVWEAASAAQKYRLDNLVAIIDRNNLQNDGVSDTIMPMEPIDRKFEAFNWEVRRINGHDMQQVLQTLEEARDFRGKPFCIVADTVKGKGVSFMENQRSWHGSPPNDEQYRQAVSEIQGALV